MKNFLAGLIVVLVLSFSAAAHAEEQNPNVTFGELPPEAVEEINRIASGESPNVNVDPYFAWEIKNPDEYNFNVAETHKQLYDLINKGQYSYAASGCRMIEAQQKISFSVNYFDAGLTELTAKLYLAADNLDEAERKINLLTNNATDNLAKIRALNLKSDLLTRRGNYDEAMAVTMEVVKLLKSTPDENLSLINFSRAAQILCKLEEFDDSLKIAEKIFPSMQEAFGEDGLETLALMSTMIEDYQKTQQYDEGLNILMDKSILTLRHYGKTNMFAVARTITDLADYSFESGDRAYGEENLSDALDFAEDYEADVFMGLQLYKEINRIATKNFDADNPMVLKSEIGLAKMYNAIDLAKCVELCEKNLPRFKKVLGEANYETLDVMRNLRESYLYLGRYADAKKIAEERLKICQKHFGEENSDTAQSKIELAEVYYHMGKYKAGDKLIADVETKNSDLFEDDEDWKEFLLAAKFTGARKSGDVNKCLECVGELNKLPNFENTNQFSGNLLNWGMDIFELLSELGLSTDGSSFERIALSFFNSFGINSHPMFLKMMNRSAESYVKYGKLKEAESYVEQILKLSRAHLGENNFCEWMALSTQAKIRRTQGKFSEALDLDNRALKIAETVCGKNSLERFQSLDAIASDHAGNGNFTEAIKIREQSLNHYGKILEDVDAITIQVRTNLAEDYVATKKFSDAVNLCDETLAVARKKIPTEISDLHLMTVSSITELTRIKAQAQKFLGDDVNAYTNYKNLVGNYETSRAAQRHIPFHNLENQSQWFAGAVPVYKEAAAVAASEKVNDTNFAFYCAEFCKGRSLIDHFDDVITAKNYLLTADEKNLLAKRQEHLDAIQAVAEYAAAGDDYNLFINAEMIYLISYTDSEEAKRRLREKYSDNMRPKDSQEENSEPWDWDVLLEKFDIEKNRQAIPDGACLVEFLKVSDDSLLVTFLQNAGDVQAANIPVDKKFFSDCRVYHTLNSYPNVQLMNRDKKFLWRTADGEFIIHDRRTAPVAGAKMINDNEQWLDVRKKFSDALSEKLLPTLEKFAGDSSHWIISPDAELNLVPFETLNFHGKFLVESKDISYVPSLAVLNLMKNREQKNSHLGQRKELFAMGDAIYGNDGSSSTTRGSHPDFFNELRNNPDAKIDLTKLKWDNLPDTARELDNVSSLFNSKEIFRREQVTEKNLRELNAGGELSKYKYLLFSTHGIFIPERPEYSSIVLSQRFNDADTDGYVTVGEWMGYDLRSNLIYLSACESGLGSYQAGEGIVSIPYALTVAGNKDTVMSLWKVEVNATTEFTSAVFEKLSRGQSEVSALNETKREFLRQNNPAYRDPSVWAAFLLYGI